VADADLPHDPLLLAAFRAAVRARIARQLEHERREAERFRESVLPCLRAAVAVARARGWCGDVRLIGSFAWGLPRPDSDVDLVVEDCAEPDRLAAQIGRACGRDVHVIPARAAPKSLRERAAQGVAL